MAEHHAGNVFIGQTALRLLAEQPVGQPAASGDGDRGQVKALGHVADGVNAGDVGVLIGIGRESCRSGSSALPPPPD
jgi:hypothetical protein